MPTTEKKNWKTTVAAIVVFYVIAIVLRFMTNKTHLLENVNVPVLKTLLQGIGPAVGALVAILAFRIPFKMTLKGKHSNLIFPFAIYWLLPMVLISVVAYFAKGTFPIVTVITILLYGLLEEIGWRGFLQPLLSPLPKIASILIVTVLWFVWHLNFQMTGANILFFFILLLGSWGIGLVADKTNSLLAVAAFHSLNNFFSEINVRTGILLAVLLTVWIVYIVYTGKKKRETALDKNPNSEEQFGTGFVEK